MADIKPIEKSRCDCCGRVEDKRVEFKELRKPEGWGSIRISPIHNGAYPDHITFNDICLACLKQVHKAVSKVIDEIHKEMK